MHCSVTMGLNITANVIVFTPFIPGTYRIVILIMSLAIRNIVVCHVYRKMKLKAVINGTTTSSSLAASRTTSLRFVSYPLGRRSHAVSSSGTRNAWVLPSVETESRSWGGIVWWEWEGNCACSSSVSKWLQGINQTRVQNSMLLAAPFTSTTFVESKRSNLKHRSWNRSAFIMYIDWRSRELDGPERLRI